MFPSIAGNLTLDRELILNSKLFDESAYVCQAGIEARPDPIGHYLRSGWRIGMEPNATFPGNLLRPYFCTIGLDGPPAITWLMLRSSGWALPSTRQELCGFADRIRESEWFDEEFYLNQVDESVKPIDAALHYVIVGEQLGFAPSPRFDPSYYRELYPDVVRGQINCLLHYIDYGKKEGRRSCPTGSRHTSCGAIDIQKENILFVLHDTSRTGAPILGWNIAKKLSLSYNIVTVLLGDGELTKTFESVSAEVYGPIPSSQRDAINIEYSLKRMFSTHKFRYAIVNSAESRHILDSCARRFIPSLLLVHEFANTLTAPRQLIWAMELATEVIFPARLVQKAAEDIHGNQRSRSSRILTQGAVELPPLNKCSDRDCLLPDLKELRSLKDSKNAFVVLGAGSVGFRKGIDLFIAAAASVRRSCPQSEIHFVWVGEGYRPEMDVHYSAYLHEQVNRSGVSDYVKFVDAVPDLTPFYELADAFFLSSRLDPFPNVVIDAAMRGIPLICFRDASGAADFLLGDSDTALGVVDHLHTDAAAGVIVQLATDKALRSRISAATLRVAERKFNSDLYVGELDALGIAASARMAQREADFKTLVDDPTFDQNMFLGPNPSMETRSTTIARYLAIAAAHDWNWGYKTRFYRPWPGFNPRLYTETHSAQLSGGIDPLADFIRNGKPAGPWQAAVITPDEINIQIDSSIPLRVALHVHFFYPELAYAFLSCVGVNHINCDLLVSTDTTEKAQQLERVLSKYKNGNVDIHVVPNKGRDIGPLLTEFAPHLDAYDVVGHVHAKRSLVLEDGGVLGDSWRRFIWQNLLGGLYPMMDRIIAAFGQQPDLGLVFPSDPHLNGWDDNRAIGEELAARIGWKGDLPDAFDFPLGTMFWMRRAALMPLLNLGFHWDDYPAEPLPYDGTLLHALERIIPIACQVAGLTHAVTHVPGISW